MAKPEHALYCCDQIRDCEQQALQIYQLDENELMSQAGTEAFFFVQRLFPQVRRIAVFCGSGNNAGDGYVLARLAHERGITVTLYQCKAVEDLPFPARTAALLALATGVDCQSVDEPLDSEVELIIDALLGIGLKGPVRGEIATAINQINASGLPVVSLDIPSGLEADTGCVANLCVKATATITFIALKAGMYTLDGPEYCGEIHCRHLQLDACVAKLKPYAFLLNKSLLPLPLPERRKNSHKGDYGNVLIIGGGPGMPGSVGLVAKAAMRVGAGLVNIATLPEHIQGILSIIPEAMIWGVQTGADLKPLLEKASVCVIGPGLGESPWAQTLFQAAITSQLPMVIDASALRLLAEYPQIDDNWVLTPHPGEAGSLLSCTSAEIQTDRYQSVAAIGQKYGGVVVLKGCGTIIQTVDKNIFVCPKGNPGMASAGMGDVLSGIIAGFCAQGFSLSEAAKLGVWIHAAAGDEMTGILGGVGMLASDILDILPKIINDSMI